MPNRNYIFQRFSIHPLVINSFKFLVLLFLIGNLTQCSSPSAPLLELKKEDRIFLVGNNLCSRMMNFGTFETEMYARFPDSLLLFRNMCDPGNTAGFRPHSGRTSPWAFSGAEEFQKENANRSDSQGHLPTEDEWMTRLEADIVLGFFGYNESFEGPERLDNFKAELTAFIEHTYSQKYNGSTSPKLVLVTPIAFQDLTAKYDFPNGKKENYNLAQYATAMKEVAEEKGVGVVDAFTASKKWYNSRDQLTIDGAQLNEKGYEKLAKLLADEIFGGSNKLKVDKTLVQKAVDEKNWFWHNDFKIPNGVHVFGRRYDPFGPDNYPAEIKKIREMTDLRDQAIWATLKGENFDLNTADKKTSNLPEVQTNYKLENENGEPEYLYGEDALKTLTVPPGYKIELFASEKEFPDLANPVQMSFDNKGRLWVAVMPSYPHYKPGDSKPNDKLLILEDTNSDGKADKQTVFADNLHLPIGFELAAEGVYLTQSPNLVLLRDTDNDDQADTKEILLSGFDDHDTHHAISAYCADPSGAIYMGEGVFLHTNVETAYGPVRGTNGGFFRYNPNRRHLERTAQLGIPNPWGIAFDEWGQNFFAETSGPDVMWMMPGSIKPVYGVSLDKGKNIIEEDHRVRPTSGIEFLHSRHFPDEVQGDLLINNTIGFLGTKQHAVSEEGTGYKTEHRHDLVKSSDTNFRPVDMEIAPDGSLYFIDWHNVLIGHMQHNARDPLRDHAHGRVYRITYPERPLVKPANISGAPIEVLLDNLKLPEYRSRYRTRRELRGRDASKVLNKLKSWTGNLEKNDPRYEHHLLEALWVSWGLNKVDQDLLQQLLKSEDHKVRAAAVKVLRYNGHQMKNQVALLSEAVQDDHGRVRLEALVAASWLDKENANEILEKASEKSLDDWMGYVHESAIANVNGKALDIVAKEIGHKKLKGADLALFAKGKEIYSREGYCITCHQQNGKGLSASQFPPLSDTEWVNGNQERLIKITLRGMIGPMEIQGKGYNGQVPMTPFAGLLNDEEIAAVLTYVRNSFGNDSSVIDPEVVKKVREETKEMNSFYTVESLLKEHPFEKENL